MNAARLQLLHELKEQLRQIERPRPGGAGLAGVSTGVAALDGLLPRKRLEGGTLLEWLSDGEGHGVMALTLAVAAHVLHGNDARQNEPGGMLAVIDTQGEFYPPAATTLGILLEQLVLLRPQNEQDALWAWEQTLRSGAVAVVLGRIDKLNDRAFRKLQLAAETGGSLAFLLRPASCREQPSWAEARFLVAARQPLLSLRDMTLRDMALWDMALRSQCLRVELLYAHGGVSGGVIDLEMRDEMDEAGFVSVVPRLADPEVAPREARA